MVGPLAPPAHADAPDGATLVRIHLPQAWDETLLSLLAEHGFGEAVAETRFPQGALASDPADLNRSSEVRLVVPVDRLPTLRTSLERWRRAWDLGEGDWRLEEEAHAPSEIDPEVLWRAQWRPFRCAGFVIHAEFHDLDALPRRPGDVPLALHPGSAFGTGGHVSTRLALRVLADWYRDRSPSRMLDVGTGSGILAVAAALMGAREVVGMDPDPFSAAQAVANAKLNGVGDACQFWTGGFDSARGSWPRVMANLVADLIQGGAQALADLVAPGGQLFAGGILDVSWEETCTTLEEAGLRLEQSLTGGRWAAGVWAKP